MSKPVSFLASIFKLPGLREWRAPRSAPLFPGLTALLFAAGCASMEQIAPPVSRISTSANSPQLAFGRELYLGKCTACHTAEPVARYSATRWPGIIREMSIESKFTPAQEQAVLAYVLAARQVQVP